MGNRPEGRPLYRNTFHCLATMAKQEGVGRLYRSVAVISGCCCPLDWHHKLVSAYAVHVGVPGVRTAACAMQVSVCLDC